MTDLDRDGIPDEKQTLDMYHFSSRKTMWLAALVIVGLLIAVLYWMLRPEAA